VARSNRGDALATPKPVIVPKPQGPTDEELLDLPTDTTP